MNAPTGTEFRADAYIDVLRERLRQDHKWGEQNHNDFVWLSILTEEIGEFSQVANDLYFNKWTPDQVIAAKAHLREEAVQVAAVALAIVESIDRRAS